MLFNTLTECQKHGLMFINSTRYNVFSVLRGISANIFIKLKNFYYFLCNLLIKNMLKNIANTIYYITFDQFFLRIRF